MLKLRRNQNGYAGWELLLLLLLLLLLILLGWWVWKQQDKDKTDSDTQSNQQASNNQKQAEEVQVKYLEIPELGIKMQLNATTDDAYYKMSVADANVAYLSLTSLKNIDDCAAEKTGIAAVGRYTKTDTDEQTGKTYEEMANQTGKVIGNYAYLVNQAQAYCTEDAASQAKSEAARSAFPQLTIVAI